MSITINATLTKHELQLKVSSNIFSGEGVDILKAIEELGDEVKKGGQSKEQYDGLTISWTEEEEHNQIKRIIDHYNRNMKGEVKGHAKKGDNETIVTIVSSKVLSNEKYFHNFGKDDTGKVKKFFHFGRFYESMM